MAFRKKVSRRSKFKRRGGGFKKRRGGFKKRGSRKPKGSLRLIVGNRL